MKRMVLACAAALLGGALALGDAEAARLGGARSLGAQRSLRSAPPAQAPRAAPSAAPAQNAAPQAPAAQPAPAGGGWLPIVGGLAAGGVLGMLFGGSGLGALIMIAFVAFAAITMVRLLAQRREAPRPPLRYAGDAAWPAVGTETVAAPPPSQAAGFDAPAPAAQASVPAGFDAAGFLRNAKLNFMKLQLANDRGDLDELREFTSPELFEELKKEVLAHGGARRQTDVLALGADLLEVVTEGDRHWASVRFAGSVRESPAEAPVGFEEVWNLVKPVDGSSGWLLAGIQQMH